MWYPIRTDFNKKYLEDIPSWAIDVIKEEAGELINKFNYTPEGP
jgi:hypothetical protein